MFIQIHTLTAYPAALLNRDDAGLAKRIPFGDATRLRVSSQCLKRHWRDYLVKTKPEFQDGSRTRHIFETINEHLTQQGISPGIAAAVSQEMKDLLLSNKQKEEGDGGDKNEKDNNLMVKQAAFFSQPEIDHLKSVALTAAQGVADTDIAQGNVREALTGQREKPKKKRSAVEKSRLTENYQALLKAAGMGNPRAALTAALFGRFVTSDILARVDAPVHVAHAFTVHAARTEMDYFTVVDDLNRDEETGAAHANETELGAGLYYGYVAVDVPLLVSNLTGCEAKDWAAQDPEPARQVLATLIRAIAEQSPGAKLGSTAPYSRAECVLLEAGPQQPRTLANAWLRAQQAKDSPMRQAVDEMAGHLRRLDEMYGATADTRALATTEDGAAFAPLAPQSLAEAIDTILAAALPAKA